MNRFVYLAFLILFFCTTKRTFGQGNTCASATNLGTNPTGTTTYTGHTTCGKVNDYTRQASSPFEGFCGNAFWGGGEDAVYRIDITSAPRTYNITLTQTGCNSPILQVFSGCPSPTTRPTNCLTGGTIKTSLSCGTASGDVTFASNGTYYLVVDNFSGTTCYSYNLSVQHVVPPTPGTNCSAAFTITPPASGSQLYTGTTCGFVNSFTNSNCGGGSGEDFVYELNVTNAPSSYQIELTSTTTGQTGWDFSISEVDNCNSLNTSASGAGGCYQPYVGTSGQATTKGVATFKTNGKYYLKIDKFSSGCTAFNLRMTFHTSSTAVNNSCPRDLNSFTDNDDCYNARQVYLNLGVNGRTINNTVDLPANLNVKGSSLFCGTLENNVWYKFTVRAGATSSSFRIDNIASCAQGIQAVVYSFSGGGGPCTPGSTITLRNGSATLTPACTPSGLSTQTCIYPTSSCATNTIDITATGLTAGQTYYLMVDGNGGAQCDFRLTPTAGVTDPPALPTANFSATTTLCAGQSITFTNSSTNALTYYWQFPGGSPSTSCDASPTVTYSTAGCYDVILTTQNYAGQDVETKTNYICVSAQPTPANAGSSPVVGCGASSVNMNANTISVGTGTWSVISGTGITISPLNSPTATVSGLTSGSSYTLRWTSANGSCTSTSNVTISVPTLPTAPTATGGSSVCAGGTITLTASGAGGGQGYRWYDQASGGTLLHTGTTYSPSVASTTTFYVAKYNTTSPFCESATRTPVTATINDPTGLLFTWTGAGSTLADNWFDGANWDRGCPPTCASDVLIPVVGSGNYPKISSTAGTRRITLNGGASLGFSASTGILNVCGDFYHYGNLPANTTTAGGTIAFIGTVAQTYYRDGSPTGCFPNLVINNSHSGVTLVSPINGNMIVGDLGTLTFQNGKIFTNITLPENVVNVRNAATGAVMGYNDDRYVQGKLRRLIANGGGSYDFPVGSAAKGYQLANIHFNEGNSGATDLRLTTYFNDGLPTGGVPVTEDCTVEYETFLNNGFWTIESNLTTTAKYRASFRNRNFSNSAGPFYTVAKRPNAMGSWGWNGLCVASSTDLLAIRDEMTGFSDFVTFKVLRYRFRLSSSVLKHSSHLTVYCSTGAR
jgi:PKD repeat protein